jgi:hypothetical protein
MPLYLPFWGWWLELAYGISRVWAVGPKLQFQYYATEAEINRHLQQELHLSSQILDCV